jgi:hypothetical protein
MFALLLKNEMFRYLAEPRNILAEPRLKNTDLDYKAIKVLQNQTV